MAASGQPDPIVGLLAVQKAAEDELTRPGKDIDDDDPIFMCDADAALIGVPALTLAGAWLGRQS